MNVHHVTRAVQAICEGSPVRCKCQWQAGAFRWTFYRQGRYVGTVTEGPEYESCAMLGSNLGIDNYAAVLHATGLCDELGIDTISTGSISRPLSSRRNCPARMVLMTLACRPLKG